jgi:hypothetical protein
MAGRTIVECGKGKENPYHVRMVAVYGKPLTGRLEKSLAGAVTGDDVKRALQMFARSVLARVRNGLKQTAYSAHARSILAAALTFEIRVSSLTVVARHPAFRPLVLGQRRQQMSWLTKARSPIPIVTDSGKLIFRSATPRSMQNGMWVHPGRPNTGILDRAIKEAKVVVRKQIRKALVQRMRKALVQ